MGDQDLRELQTQIGQLKAELAELRRSPVLRWRERLVCVASSRRVRLALVVAVLGVAAVSYAAQISMPYTFVNGTIADANEVNANFGVLVTESNAQDLRIGALEASPPGGTVTSVNTGSGLAGGPITTTGTIYIPTDGITASHIAAGAVRASEIATGAVGASEIGAGAVGASEIANGAVGSGEIATGAVTADEIATNAVGSDEIATGAVSTAEITAGAVTASEIAADAVRLSEIDFSFTQNSIYLSAGESESVTLTCPAGHTAISGTWRQAATGGGSRQRSINNWTNGNPSFVGGGTWQFGFYNPSGTAVDINVGVWCFRNS
ncbi:MAG: hypothetical protein JRS35_29070 [Deltaproteobacteria bacterium]|nr:hypothetical protein [Deltaproteobacteria bacterium]